MRGTIFCVKDKCINHLTSEIHFHLLHHLLKIYLNQLFNTNTLVMKGRLNH